MTTQTQTQFIVRMPGASYAFKFHRNLCGRMHTPVADRDATKFDDRAQAEETAIQHGLRAGQFEITPVEPASQS